MLPLSGLRVAVFESRRASELLDLVLRRGGEVVLAPATTIVPLEPGPGAVELAARLRAGDVEAMLFLTDTGIRLLPDLMAPIMGRDELLGRLAELRLGARGPKTAAALADLGLPEPVVSAPPHTWRSLAAAFDEAFPVTGRVVGVQETGRVHAPLRAELMDRGAEVLEIAVYRLALPEDTAPLAEAARGLVSGAIRLALFTNATQIEHLMTVAAQAGIAEPLRRALEGVVVAAIGPYCADRLSAFGVRADIVPDTPRMDRLVAEVAARAGELLEKR